MSGQFISTRLSHSTAAIVLCLISWPARGALLAGGIPASWDVSPNGAAQYTIPIRMTEGINGMTPRLAVSYNGGGERSILGVGYVLAGLSAISPCSRTIVQDGYAGPVGLYTSDPYCLDGVRLRHLPGTSYGSAGSQYRAEIDQLSLVTVMAATPQNIPIWFKVQTRDGLVYEYGKTDDSKLGVQFWAVNEIYDKHNNRIKFTYDRDEASSRFRPLSILYTESAAGAARYKVVFQYQSTPQPGPVEQITPGLAAGDSQVETHLLERINLQHDDGGGFVTYRDYRFTYESGAGTNRRLKEVEECGAGPSGTDCLPKTMMTWQSATAGHSILSTTSNVRGQVPLDINGDGFEDLTWSYNGTWWISLGSANGLGIATNTTFQAFGAGRPLEWDGDGRMDLLVPWSDGKFRVLRGTATGFASPVAAGPGAGVASNTANSDWHVADFNGDGKDDLLRLRTNDTFELYGRVNGTGGLGAEYVVASNQYLTSQGWGFLNQPYGTSSVRKPDFNGDGQTDLLLYLCEWESELQYCMWWGWYYFVAMGNTYQLQTNIPDATYMNQPRYGDFNNDGLTDIAYAGQSWNKFCFGFGQGGGGMITSCGPTALSTYGLQSMLTADYDGDGYDDIYVTQPNPATWHVFRSTGTGISGQGSQIATGIEFANQVTGDFNGDGLVDLGGIPYPTTTWKTYAHQGSIGERLLSVADGLGNKVSFTYLPMTSPEVYTKGTSASAPDRDFQTAMNLVRTMTVEPAGGVAYTLTYAYSNAKLNPLGRGLLGIGTRTITDNRNNVSVTETYRQDFPFIGALTNVTVKQPNGVKIIESVTHEYNKHDLNTIQYSERYMPFRWRSTTERREVGGYLDNQIITRIVDTRTVNTFGNTTLAVVDTTDKDPGSLEPDKKYTATISATYNEDQTNWCLSIPTSRAETRTLPDLTSQTRTTQWAVSACLVTQETVEPGAGSLLSLVTDL